jgi:protein gp37
MKNSSISWTDHTFNIAWGCTEVSPACDHCDANLMARRWTRCLRQGSAQGNV